MRFLQIVIVCFLASVSLYGQNVGIGESSPNVKLDIKGDGGNDLLSIRDDQGTSRVYVQENGNVGIGDANPANKLDVNGNIQVNSTILHGSDNRLSVYNNTNKTDSRSWIELWGQDSNQEGELTLSGSYISMRTNSSTTGTGSESMTIAGNGEVTVNDLSGSDIRTVVANGNGTLETNQAIGKSYINDCNITGTYNLPIEVKYDTYCGENSWELVQVSNNSVITSGGNCASGEGNFSATLDYGEEYEFRAYDSYGDGWNGNAYFNLGSPVNSGNINVSGYGVIYSFSYQPCTQSLEVQRIVRGSIQSDGSTEGGGGFSITSFGSGRYEIEFVPSFSNRPSATVTQVDSDFDSNGWGGSTLNNAIITHLDSSKMRVKTGDNSGNGTNRDFSFLVIGSD